ncbi:hypothetical protein MCUN1_003766 [Malassezia cuniculi]|uniref:Ribosome recycling factor domain-containing protein n=1 Tax=Malassezia cuniculi TaxID=948313 RepID=A0AAF0EXJ0_9BASI|nr:hypothetical protein MCUN1_003766 [Malassezia cuniculi]
MHARLLSRLAWRTVPRAATLAPLATQVPRIVLATTATRPLSVSAIAFKKKKGGAEPAPAEPAEAQFDPDAIQQQMQVHADKCREAVHGIVASFGRVDASLLDPVRVSVGKGSKPSPLHDYATVSVRDNMLLVTAYDPDSLKHIERAIHAAQLGVAPRVVPEEGEGVLVVPVPRPTGETRQLLANKCTKAGETAQAAVRNVRQTAQKHLKHDLDAKIVSKT